MKLHALGHIPWLDSQLLYHALPRLNREGLFILSSREPYVCIGCQQNLDQGVDTAYCDAEDIAIFRREVGGRTLYVDGRQILYQFVLRGDNPLLASGREALHRKLLTSVARTCRDLGIPAEYQSGNDIVVKGRRIASSEVGEIAGSFVMTGSLLLDLAHATLSQALKEGDKHMASVVRELGWMPPTADLVAFLRVNFEAVLGSLKLADVGSDLRAKVDELKPHFTSERWLSRGHE